MGVVMDETTPEPDIAVVAQPRAQFKNRHPSPHEVEILVEVADATLALDLGPKQRSYARNALKCLWVADIPSSHLHVFTGPTGPVDEPGYANHVVLNETDSVAVELRDKVIGHLKVSDFFR
jgi:hypothetical protein